MNYTVRKTKKIIGKFKNKCPKNTWTDDFVYLRSKAYSFKCKNNDGSKNKIKRISKSQSKHNKFEEYYNCLFGGEYQKNVILISFDLLVMKWFFKK